MSRPAALVDADWMEQAVQTIRRIARRRLPFTSEDLRREMEQEPENPNRYGAAFTSAQARKYIEKIGYRASGDKSRRGGVVAVWKIHPEAEARQITYLGAHVEEAPSRLFSKPVRIAGIIAATHGAGTPISGDLIARHRHKENRA